MDINTIQVGINSTNCYIVEVNNRDAFIIDPGADGEKILNFIQNKDLNISGIILTHGHFDHIGAVKYLREELNVIVSIHQFDNPMLLDAKKNLSFMIGDNIELERADRLLADDDYFNGFKVIATPGHTPGGISIYHQEEGILFSGDTIFKNGYGRTDFPGADKEKLFASIKKLLRLPVDTTVYPGHGPITTIGNFKTYIG